MMNKFLFLFFVISLSSAAPLDNEAKILKSDFDLNPSGAYQFGFDTENAIHREEVGDIKPIKNEEGKDEGVVVVQGRFSYSLPTGETIEVTYTADENGFHPIGAHLPPAADIGNPGNDDNRKPLGRR